MKLSKPVLTDGVVRLTREAFLALHRDVRLGTPADNPRCLVLDEQQHTVLAPVVIVDGGP